MAEWKPPKPRSTEDREVDYLICNQCSSPCYVFEMREGSIAEAQCLVCGNDNAGLFAIGDEEGSEDAS